MQLKRWSRVDQVLLEAMLWVLPVALLLGVVRDAARAVRGRPLEVSGTLPDGLVTLREPVTGPITGTVVVQDPVAAQYGWDLVPSVLLLVLAVVVARLLLGVTRSLRHGDPFTTVNARRLATLSIVLILGGAFVPMVQGIALEGVLGPLVSDAASTWRLHLPLWPAVSGILVGFLAEVFSRGARMREDVEGLV